MPGRTLGERALLGSQGGPLAALPNSVVPVSPLLRFDPGLFGVLLLRRLHLPLPALAGVVVLSTALATTVQVARGQVCLGGVIVQRSRRLPGVCREAGARVSTNMLVQDLDLVAVRAQDQRRSDVIAEGLPVFLKVQLAINTILVSPPRADGGTLMWVAQL